MKIIEVNIDNNSDKILREDLQALIICYILVCKANILNSNCVIFKSYQEIVIIDPGAYPHQKTYIDKLILEHPNNDLAVYILLTHCHLDHSFNLFSFLEKKKHNAACQVILNQPCADIFSGKGDRRILLEDFLGLDSKIPLYTPDIIMPFVLGSSLEADIAIKSAYQLSIGSIEIQCLYTPGHSPDSYCYIIDDILITGDLLIAINMGIAGTIGWNLIDLQESIKSILQYLQESNGISYLVNGHGEILNQRQSLKRVEIINNSLQDFAQIKIIDNERKKELNQDARILAQKSEEILIALAGRIHRIEYYLNEIGEYAAAEKLKVLIDFSVIDEYIEDFRNFVTYFEVEGLTGPDLFLKGINFVSRLRKIFQTELLKDIIDKHYLSICERLINAYFNEVNGYIFQNPPPFHIVDMLTDLISYIEEQYQEFTSMPLNLECEGEFTKALIKRLSYKPLVDFNPEIILSNELKLADPLVFGDREALADILYAILEFFARKKSEVIRIKIFAEDSLTKISIFSDKKVKLLAENIDFYNMLIDNWKVEAVYCSEINSEYNDGVIIQEVSGKSGSAKILHL